MASITNLTQIEKLEPRLDAAHTHLSALLEWDGLHQTPNSFNTYLSNQYQLVVIHSQKLEVGIITAGGTQGLCPWTIVFWYLIF